MRALLRSAVSFGVFLLLVAVVAERACALGEESFGPAGEHIGRSPDWPKGVEDVLRHGSRVYWRDVNGSESAYFDGDIAVVNELLKLYSQVDLPKLDVVIRPGRPSAKSFDGKATPYVVEFDVPGGIVLHHLMQYANTGLFPMTPRMIIHFDAKLAEHLVELKIPGNVTLHETSFRLEDALAYADDKDLTVRYRALVALAEWTDSTRAGLAALLRATRDENESIRTIGSEAMVRITAADPAEQSLRTRLVDFVRSQPQYAQAITPEKLLEALRAADAEYAKGFTARGTMVEAAASGPGKLVAWTVTMGDDRLVIEQRDVEDAEHPPTPGRFEYTIYSSPQKMGALHGYHTWVDGKLSTMKPHASFEPPGSTYDLLIGRVLWPLGRGFTRRIDEITSVASTASGLLKVAATSNDGSLMSRWELEIDPVANYLVRSAKAFSRDETEPSYTIETAGVLTGGAPASGGRSIAHTARWIEGASGLPVSIAATMVSATADDELIRQTEKRLEELGRQGP